MNLLHLRCGDNVNPTRQRLVAAGCGVPVGPGVAPFVYAGPAREYRLCLDCWRPAAADAQNDPHDQPRKRHSNPDSQQGRRRRKG